MDIIQSLEKITLYGKVVNKLLIEAQVSIQAMINIWGQ